MVYRRLGDLLVSVGLITQEQLETALTNQKKTKYRLGKQLISEGIISEQQFIEALEMQLGIEFIDLTKTKIDPKMTQYVSKNLATKYGIVPVNFKNDTLYLAMSDPLNFIAIEEVRNATKKQIIPMIATAEAIDRSIATLYGMQGAEKAIAEIETDNKDKSFAANFYAQNIGKDDENSAPTVRLVNSIIERAMAERASDIHIEPFENDLRVRMRIDGMMHKILTLPKNVQASVVSRLKVMGGMDITEHRIPLDGRATVRVHQTDIDLRMSTLPTIFGEKIVLRILDKSSQLLDKYKIGLEGADLTKYDQLINKPSGVLLIAGPTGSGKSSTMYTMINELNTDKVNLITLEDPVEFNIDGISQVQINEKTHMTFSSGLRSILRQDPDIIAVGEIRDGETAKIAMRAAITGHLVLSTIHTNSAAATLERLLDIGVEPYLIVSALNGVISQRLVRKICPDCRTEYTPTKDELRDLGLPEDYDKKLYKGKGCSSCFGTGYRGRVGVFEILVMSQEIRSAFSKGMRGEEFKDILKKSDNFVTMAENCRRLVTAGIITTDEAKRTVNEEDFL